MRMVRQRGPNDCGVAALAMVCGVTYAAAERAIARAGYAAKPDGLSCYQLVEAAKVLGVRLVSRRHSRFRPLPATDAILSVLGPKVWRGGHFVAFSRGVVRCPTFKSSDPVARYIARTHARVCTILERRDDAARGRFA